MAVIADLVTRLSVNKAKFEADMKRASTFASGTAARHASMFSARWKLAFRTTGAGVIALGATFRAFGRIAQRTIAITSRMIRDFGTLSRFFLLGAGAGGLGIFGSFKFVNNMSAKAEDIIQFSNALGISTQTLQEWQIAGESVGFTGDKVVDVLKDASEKIGDLDITGGGELSEIVKKLKFDFEQLKGVAPDVAIKNLFKAIEPLNRQQQTTVVEAISNDLVKMIPLLENGAAGFDKLVDSAHQAGRIQSDDDLAKLNEYQRSLRDLKNLWESFKNKLAVELSGKFTNLVRDLTAYMKNLDLGESAKQASALIVSAISTFVTVATALTQAVLLAAQGIAMAAKYIVERREGISKAASWLNPSKVATKTFESLTGIKKPTAGNQFSTDVSHLYGKDKSVWEKMGLAVEKGLKGIEDFSDRSRGMLGELRRLVTTAFKKDDPKPVLPSTLPSIMEKFGKRTQQAAEALGAIGSKIKSFQKAISDKIIERTLGDRIRGISESDRFFHELSVENAMRRNKDLTREEAERQSHYFDKINPEAKATPGFDRNVQKLFDRISTIKNPTKETDKDISFAISELRSSAVKLGPAFTGVVDELKKYAQEAGVIVAQKVQLEAEFYLEDGLVIKHLKSTGAKEVIGSMQWSNIEKIAQTGG